MVPKQLPTLPQHFPRDFFSWSRDGSTVAFTQTMNAYTADDDHAVIALLDIASGRAHKLTRHAGLESGGEFSPDGRRIAYWYPRNGVAIGSSDIYVTARSGGEGIDVTRRLDRSPWLALWMPDSASLLIVAHDGTHENIWIVRLDGSFRKLDTGDRSVSTAAVSRTGAIAFVASGPQSPSELFYLSSPAAKARALTQVNRYFSSLRLGRVASISWQGPDGFLEDGVLTYPPGFVAGKRYPLVLQIHGWPAYASQAAFDTDYPGLTQYLAASGYVVFEPNYRGSDNLGNAYEVALLGDTADGPGRDIMAGIAAVEKLGFVDAGRIGVSGWSYGGFMTAWLDQPLCHLESGHGRRRPHRHSRATMRFRTITCSIVIIMAARRGRRRRCSSATWSSPSCPTLGTLTPRRCCCRLRATPPCRSAIRTNCSMRCTIAGCLFVSSPTIAANIFPAIQ